MTDRELLEAAAKAAGYTGQWDANWYAMCDGENYWSPLRHNGQAFRLAVSMCLTVKVDSHEVEVSDQDGCLVSIPIFRASRFVDADNVTDPYAATRRAITRAAAEIGRANDDQ